MLGRSGRFSKTGMSRQSCLALGLAAYLTDRSTDAECVVTILPTGQLFGDLNGTSQSSERKPS